MPLFKCNEKELFFLHIPKTGGSTISHGIDNLKNQSKEILYRTVDDQITDDTVPPQHYTYQECLDNIPDFNLIPKFTIIRNPSDRTVSDFLWQDENPTKLHSKRFNKWLFKSLKMYKKMNSYKHNHFVPQSNFIEKDVKVFLYENHIQAREYVNNYFDTDISIRKFLKRSNVKRKPHVKELCDDGIYKMWLEVYQKDIKLYEKLKRDLQ